MRSESYNTAVLTGSKLADSNDTITKVQSSCRPQLNFITLQHVCTYAVSVSVSTLKCRQWETLRFTFIQDYG